MMATDSTDKFGKGAVDEVARSLESYRQPRQEEPPSGIYGKAATHSRFSTAIFMSAPK
jgi:hypothetical protein